MIKEYIKKQPSVKAIQFHGLRDIADVAELIGINLATAKVVIQNQPDGYSIQFNESAPVYLRVGAWIVKTGDDLEVLGDAQFRTKYEETKQFRTKYEETKQFRTKYEETKQLGYPTLLGTLIDQRDYLAGK